MKVVHLARAIANASLSAAVVAASGWLALQHPREAWPYVLSASIVVVAWVARWMASRSAPRNTRSARNAHYLAQATFWGPLLLLAALAAAILEGVPAHPEAARRVLGVLSGLVVVAMSNGIPKEAGSPARQRALRIAGWSFVIGGIAYALAWLLVPLPMASTVAASVMLTSLVVAALGIARSRTRQTP